MKNPIATSDHTLSQFKTHKAIELIQQAGYDAVELWQQNLFHRIKLGQTSLKNKTGT